MGGPFPWHVEGGAPPRRSTNGRGNSPPQGSAILLKRYSPSTPPGFTQAHHSAVGGKTDLARSAFPGRCKEGLGAGTLDLSVRSRCRECGSGSPLNRLNPIPYSPLPV